MVSSPSRSGSKWYSPGVEAVDPQSGDVELERVERAAGRDGAQRERVPPVGRVERVRHAVACEQHRCELVRAEGSRPRTRGSTTARRSPPTAPSRAASAPASRTRSPPWRLTARVELSWSSGLVSRRRAPSIWRPIIDGGDLRRLVVRLGRVVERGLLPVEKADPARRLLRPRCSRERVRVGVQVGRPKRSSGRAPLRTPPRTCACRRGSGRPRRRRARRARARRRARRRSPAERTSGLVTSTA